MPVLGEENGRVLADERQQLVDDAGQAMGFERQDDEVLLPQLPRILRHPRMDQMALAPPASR